MVGWETKVSSWDKHRIEWLNGGFSIAMIVFFGGAYKFIGPVTKQESHFSHGPSCPSTTVGPDPSYRSSTWQVALSQNRLPGKNIPARDPKQCGGSKKTMYYN
jgi:hypothetical protein